MLDKIKQSYLCVNEIMREERENKAERNFKNKGLKFLSFMTSRIYRYNMLNEYQAQWKQRSQYRGLL